jgi:hypothetical protein
MEIPCDPVIPYFGTDSRELKACLTKTSRPMFIATSLIEVRK